MQTGEIFVEILSDYHGSVIVLPLFNIFIKSKYSIEMTNYNKKSHYIVFLKLYLLHRFNNQSCTVIFVIFLKIYLIFFCFAIAILVLLVYNRERKG